MKKINLKIITLSIFLAAFSIQAQERIDIRLEDKIRIKEAKQIATKFGDSIWPEFRKTPFTIILVTDQYEFLIDHPYPSKDFQFLRKDDILEADIYYRKQQFNKSFLATFPAVNGVNCVVIGTPENTNHNSTQWIITLLHEHFHQYQYNSPNYHQDALKLGLSNGDETGMWQINYPFPYEEADVIRAYESYTIQLRKTIENINDKDWKRNYKKLIRKRKLFKNTLSENDYKYLLFQWYQEGVARFTEYAFLELLKNYIPEIEVSSLNDFIPYDKYIHEFYLKHIANVTNLKLDKFKRVTVYDVGFAESLVIRKKNPDWNNNYLKEKFDLRKFY